jgi:hypothetical protein
MTTAEATAYGFTPADVTAYGRALRRARWACERVNGCDCADCIARVASGVESPEWTRGCCFSRLNTSDARGVDAVLSAYAA